MNRIAVLGGAFDPPHNSHIAIAFNAIEQCGYTKIVVLPSANPPHKRAVGEVNHRFNMVKLAFDHPQIQICDMELNQDGYGYTVDTIPKLQQYLGEDFDFIIGGDSMRDFHKWYRYADILTQVKIVVAVRDRDFDSVSRAINALNDLPKVGIQILDYHPESISSSRLRLMRELGQEIQEFLPKTVYQYIVDNNLYSSYDALREKLKSSLDKDRYEHSLRTVAYAMQLQSKLGLSYDKTFIATLLHDCAKCCDNYADFLIPQDSIGTPVAHAFAGSYIAKHEYGIDDNEILDAIYYHTTACDDMTALAKVVFVADMLEVGRSFEGVESLRRAVDTDFEKGFCQCVRATYEHLLAKNCEIYPLTTQAFHRYS